MKSLENKITTIEMPSPENGSAKAEYADLISLLIKAPKQGGFDYSDIETRIAINKAVTDAKAKTGEEVKTIDLEDAAFKYLKELVTSTKWQFWHEDILKFKEDIQAVK
jgi:hypothetical protein